MFGTTAECIKASIKMIRNMVSEFIPGQMAVVMKDTGLRESSMELELMQSPRSKR